MSTPRRSRSHRRPRLFTGRPLRIHPRLFFARALPFPAKASVSICLEVPLHVTSSCFSPQRGCFRCFFSFHLKKRKPRHAPSSLYPRTATRRETKTPPTSIYPSAAVARRPRGAFPLQLDEKRLPLPLSRGYREGAGCARCPVRPGLLH